MPTRAGTPPSVAEIRAFNRFYTRQIGLLNEGLLDSPFSLTEVRVLYELAHRDRPTASDLRRDLGLDPGYLSRLLRRFETQGVVQKSTAPHDAREQLLSLTVRGRRLFAPLEARSDAQVTAMLGALSSAGQAELIRAMRTITSALGAERHSSKAFVLRPPRPGDMGWVVQRHGELYWREYRYDERFEALVAGIVAHFVEHRDDARERCWIAERDGENVGSVFVVRRSDTVAKLRLLLVEPAARGLGIGGRLVAECIRFARATGYTNMKLWTQSELGAARALYERAGFTLAETKRHDSWGRRGLVAETWQLKM